MEVLIAVADNTVTVVDSVSSFFLLIVGLVVVVVGYYVRVLFVRFVH